MKKIFVKLNNIRNNRPRLWFFFYLILITILAVGLMYLEEYLAPIVFTLLLILLIIITLMAWFMAAVAVFRSLLIVGAGLSLLLFISIEYCNLPLHERIADDALMSLIGISVIFIVSIFSYRLYRELFGNPDAKNEFDQKGALMIFREANQGKDPKLFLILYALFVGLIVSQVYQVLFPVFSNLCVYS